MSLLTTKSDQTTHQSQKKKNNPPLDRAVTDSLRCSFVYTLPPSLRYRLYGAFRS